MGARGPLPKPAAQRIAGKIGMDSHSEKTFSRGVPMRPKFLKGAAAVEWERVIPELESAGLLSRVDAGVLAGYCQAYAELQWATEKIAKEGRVLVVKQTTSKGEVLGDKSVIHPAVKIQREAMAQIAKFSSLLGFSPASRPRVGAKISNGKVKDGEGDNGEGQSGGEGKGIKGIAWRIEKARGKAEVG